MKWWQRFLGAKPDASLDGQEYRVATKLYSQDGQREVELREFRHGPTYLLERELDSSGVLVDRHSGSLVGPFKSPQAAEKFIVATAWFNGADA